jgi:hypothetical protein
MVVDKKATCWGAVKTGENWQGGLRFYATPEQMAG